MKKALYNLATGQILDEQLEEFPVHPSLGWITCPDETRRDTHRVENGVVVLIPVATVPLDEAKAAAFLQIDRFAESVRLRYITPGAGQAATYLLKERHAEDFKGGGYAGPPPSMVQAEVDATGLAAQQAADMILAERDFWVAKAADIERERRKAKVAIDAALDHEAVEVERLAGLAALNAL